MLDSGGSVTVERRHDRLEADLAGARQPWTSRGWQRPPTTACERFVKTQTHLLAWLPPSATEQRCLEERRQQATSTRKNPTGCAPPPPMLHPRPIIVHMLQ